MDNNELSHWGILGMKWGKRRYQNKDGSLTPAGQKRYNKEYSKLSNKKKKEYKSDPDRWATEDIEATKRLADASGQMTRDAQRFTRSNGKTTRSKSQRMDLSTKTDKELREEINRELLERQYDDLFNTKTTTSGREKVNSILETSGNVLAVGSSALAIALAIKQLKG